MIDTLITREVQALVVSLSDDRHVVFGLDAFPRRYSTYASCTSIESARAALRLLAVGTTAVAATEAELADWTETVGEICRRVHAEVPS